MTDFNPDWTVAPGGTLHDLMRERGWSRQELATRCYMDRAIIDGIIDGSVEITRVRAYKLAVGTETSAQFWLNYERRFRDDIAKGRKWNP